MTEANLVQPFSGIEPYTVSINYTIPNCAGDMRQYLLEAIVDSGSPISLIKDDHVPIDCRTPVAKEDYKFSGINRSRIEILGIFENWVKVNDIDICIKFFVVPDITMSSVALLGRDFIAHPTIKVEFGKPLRISRNSPDISQEKDDFDKQIMHINCDNHSADRPDLNINPDVSPDVVEAPESAYRNVYLTNGKSVILPDEPEITISLKHDQPISFRARRLAYADKLKLDAILKDLLKEKIIRESTSPYASPIVLVRKKDGNLRLCVDCRELNKIIIKDNFPTPMIEDHIDRLKRKNLQLSRSEKRISSY